MESLRWRIARAYRRLARLLSVRQLFLAKQLGLAAALPCAPRHLPRPILSEFLKRTAYLVIDASVTTLQAMRTLWKMVPGERHLWRLTD